MKEGSSKSRERRCVQGLGKHVGWYKRGSSKRHLTVKRQLADRKGNKQVMKLKGANVSSLNGG